MATQRDKDDPLFPLDFINIRWCDLFGLFSDQELDIICGKNQEDGNQKYFAKAILPADMFDAMFSSARGGEKSDGYVSKTTFSRFFEVRKSQIKSAYKKAYNYLTKPNPDTGISFTYQDAYFIKEVSDNWTKIIADLSSTSFNIEDRIREDVRRLIEENIDNDKDKFDLKDTLLKLLSVGLIDLLTPLTFIVSTINHWDDQYCEELFYILKEPEVIKSQFDNWQDLSQENQTKAENLILIAREKFDYSPSGKDYKDAINECCEICQTIVSFRPQVNRILRGEAYYMLYICAKEREYKIPLGDSRDQYLIQSNKCGYKKAQKEYLRKHPNSLVRKISSPDPTGKGACIFNSQNEQSLFLMRSCPTTYWEKKMFDRDNLSSIIIPNQTSKFFLLDDDYLKNISDALYVLQYMKDTCDRSNISNEVEIYLRADEDFAAPLIDTALSHISNIIVPVHIIDDNKSAAQFLLSAHPIYYPLHTLPMNTKASLNLVVIGDSKCADWIIREGFWLMSFRNPNITTKITIVAENPNEIEGRLSATCPGMFNSDQCLGRNHKIDDINFTSIKKIESSLKTNKLKTVVNELILNPNEYTYFVVCTESDQFNLSCAIRLREWMIKEYIAQNRINQIERLPIITYKCTNPDIAHLSKNMVVHNEAYGNCWYNSYVIIPFGSYAERYTWDKIDGGILGKIALCIHFEYNGIPIEKDKRDPEAVKQALKSYYGRYYDRDSSYSLAMFIPSYRLFQCNYDDHRTIPTHWSIEDENAFFTEEELALLAERYSKVIEDTNEKYEDLGKLEHDRWVRWMCSRGWLPSDFQQTADYINIGQNPRQQLYIAKLHPCMCGWEKLDKLSRYLNEQCKDFNKNFKKLDLENVRKTPEFLKMSWLK